MRYVCVADERFHKELTENTDVIEIASFSSHNAIGFSPSPLEREHTLMSTWPNHFFWLGQEKKVSPVLYRSAATLLSQRASAFLPAECQPDVLCK